MWFLEMMMFLLSSKTSNRTQKRSIYFNYLGSEYNKGLELYIPRNEMIKTILHNYFVLIGTYPSHLKFSTGHHNDLKRNKRWDEMKIVLMKHNFTFKIKYEF